MNEVAYSNWLASAEPGNTFVYHVGDLAADIDCEPDPGRHSRLTKFRARIWKDARAGHIRIHMRPTSQPYSGLKDIGRVFEYFAVKRSPWHEQAQRGSRASAATQMVSRPNTGLNTASN